MAAWVERLRTKRRCGFLGRLVESNTIQTSKPTDEQSIKSDIQVRHLSQTFKSEINAATAFQAETSLPKQLSCPIVIILTKSANIF